jgi:RNA polymerase sigma factor (sigma-70 family)
MYAEPRGNAEVRELATQLYREQRPYLLAIARPNATSAADAEEALNEAFVSFINHYDPDGAAPALPWLILTLKRQCWRQSRDAHFDRWVRGDRGGEHEEPLARLQTLASSMPGPEQQVIDREGARGRLAALKPDQRRAMLLRAAGYSYLEIAEHRGWTYSKVDRCVRRGRGRLRATSPLTS